MDGISGVSDGDISSDSGVEGVSGAEEPSAVDQLRTTLENAGIETEDLDIEELAEDLQAQDSLSGIGVVPEPSAVSQIGRATTQAVSRQRLVQELEEQSRQFSELDDIQSILIQVSSQLQTLNQGILRVISAVESLDEKTGLNSASLKDFNLRSINAVDTKQDVTEETDIATSRIYIKAKAGNEGSLFFGDDTTQVNDGFELEPGEREEFPVDISNFPFKVAGEESGDKYTYISFGP